MLTQVILLPKLANSKEDEPKPLHVYQTELDHKAAASEAYTLTNTPKNLISKPEMSKIKGYKGRPLTKGDTVQTLREGVCMHHTCTEKGWDRKPVDKPITLDPKKAIEEERNKLFKRIQGLINDYSGPYFSHLKAFNFKAPSKRLQEFYRDLQKADGPVAEKQLLEDLGRELQEKKPGLSPEDELEKKKVKKPTMPLPNMTRDEPSMTR